MLLFMNFNAKESAPSFFENSWACFQYFLKVRKSKHQNLVKPRVQLEGQ